MSGPTGPYSTWWILLHDYNLAPTEGTLCETFPLDGNDTVEKFNSFVCPMNVKVKFDPDLV